MSGWVNAVANSDQSGWVAVGDISIVSRAKGSDTWERDKGELSGRWYAVASDAQGSWVAVGDSGIVSRAKGSDTWERAKGEVSGWWKAVASDVQGDWMAVGKTGIVSRAKESDTWERVKGAIGGDPTKGEVGGDWRAVASDGQGGWVAVGGSGIVNRAKESDTWVRAKGEVGGDWNAVASDDKGGLVAVGIDGIVSRAKGSDTWERAKGEVGGDWTAVMHDGSSGWVAISSDSFILSVDGQNWADIIPFNDFPHDVATFNLGGKLSLLRTPWGTSPSGKWKLIHQAQEWHVDGNSLFRVELGGPLPTVQNLDVRGKSAFLDVQRNGANCHGNIAETFIWAQDEYAWETAPLKLVGKSEHDLEDLNKPLQVSLELEKIKASSGRTLMVAAGLRCGIAITAFPRFPDPYFKKYVYKAWWHKWQEAPLLVTAPLAVIVLLSMLSVFVHLANPIALLNVYRRTINLGRIGELPLPGIGWKVTDILHVLNGFVVPLLIRNRRTQRAWINNHVDRWREGFENEATVRLSRGYVPLPCLLDDPDPATGRLITRPNREFALELIGGSRRRVIEVAGIGGSGKTMLVIQLSRWLLDADSTEAGGRLALPVLVEEDTTDLCATVKRKLDAVLDQVTDDFFVRLLLENGYLVPVLDRLSERDSNTIDHVRRVPGLARIRLMLVSTRREFGYEGAEKRGIFPQPLTARSLMLLLSALLIERNASEVFHHMTDHLDLANRLANMIRHGDAEVALTPLVVRLFVDRAVKLAKEGQSLDHLPSTVPDAYFIYLRDVNPKDPGIPNRMSDDDMLRAARLIAMLVLGNNFIPQEIGKVSVVEAMRHAGWTDLDNVNPIDRLLANGVLLQRPVGARYFLTFVLDPVAEYLAADEYLARCRGDRAKENELFARVRQQGKPAEGFLTALTLVKDLIERGRDRKEKRVL